MSASSSSDPPSITPPSGEPPESAPVKVRLAGWRNWGDHPVVVGLTLFAGLFAVYQGIRTRGATAPDPAPLTCDAIIGRWDWLSTGGEVAFTDQGEMYWYQIALDRLPTVSGTWTCDDGKRPLHYTLRWTQTRLVDTLTLSPRGDRLSGENMANHFKLSAVRLR